jgi:hypothetical protein
LYGKTARGPGWFLQSLSWRLCQAADCEVPIRLMLIDHLPKNCLALGNTKQHIGQSQKALNPNTFLCVGEIKKTHFLNMSKFRDNKKSPTYRVRLFLQ